MNKHEDTRPVIYGLPADLSDPIWRTHRMGGCVLNLSDPKVRAHAIASGMVWYGPMAAQHHAVRDIAAGRVPYPDYMLPEWAANTLDHYRDHPEALPDD